FRTQGPFLESQPFEMRQHFGMDFTGLEDDHCLQGPVADNGSGTTELIPTSDSDVTVCELDERLGVEFPPAVRPPKADIVGGISDVIKVAEIPQFAKNRGIAQQIGPAPLKGGGHDLVLGGAGTNEGLVDLCDKSRS